MRLSSAARPIATLPRLALGLAVLVAMPVAEARAQSARGSLGLSAVIASPVGSATVRASALSVGRTGDISMATSTPVAGPTSQIVMVDVSDDDASATAPLRITMRSEGRERTLTAGQSSPIGRDGTAPASAGADDFSVAFQVQGAAARQAQAPVRLRVRYLAVAGT